MDFFLSLYVPTERRTMQERQRVGKLWAYTGRLLDAVPARCVPILCLDANAMSLLLLAMLTVNVKTGMGSSCENFANVIIYVWSIIFSMLVLPIEVNFASPELITLPYHHHCSLLSSHVLFFIVPGNGCKRLLPLAGETIGPYIVLLPTSCATNSLQGQIFTVGIPTCWSVVFWTAMAGKRFFTMFRQPSRHSLWNNWLMSRLAHTGDTSLPWCEMKLQKCLGKKLVSRPTGL